VSQLALSSDGRNNIDGLEEDDILSEKVLFRKFYKKLSDVFLLFSQLVFVTLLLVVQTK
jgi:hypothetical protein